jgi:hypothetical protein
MECVNCASIPRVLSSRNSPACISTIKTSALVMEATLYLFAASWYICVRCQFFHADLWNWEVVL